MRSKHPKNIQFTSENKITAAVLSVGDFVVAETSVSQPGNLLTFSVENIYIYRIKVA